MILLFSVNLFTAFISSSAKANSDEAPETCESLQDQLDFYRRLAMQDRSELEKDLKKKKNRKPYQQRAIKMQLKEMEDAQKKAREIHKKLEEDC